MNERNSMISASEPKDMGDLTPMSPLRDDGGERQAKLTSLQLLRKPFPDNQISALPKPTTKQTEALKKDFTLGSRCSVCGGWHQRDVVHLDYVGHAALTDRLLDADPMWSWEPLSFGPDGLPLFDAEGGLWIRLTVCGHTRLGYGDSQGKKGPNAIKECIGDALRNAAMRFGAALDLWHKGELHKTDQDSDTNDPVEQAVQRKNSHDAALGRWYKSVDYIKNELSKDAPDMHGVAEAWGEIPQADQMALWLATSKGGVFTTNERKTIKEDLPRGAAPDAEGNKALQIDPDTGEVLPPHLQ